MQRRLRVLRLIIQDHHLHISCAQLRLILRSIFEASDPLTEGEYVQCVVLLNGTVGLFTPSDHADCLCAWSCWCCG